MKVELPINYIVNAKGNKYYVIFDYVDQTGKRIREWKKTGLNVNCEKADLDIIVDKIKMDFCKQYFSLQSCETDTALYKRLDSNGDKVLASDTEYSFTEYLVLWLEIKRRNGLAETTYKGYKSKLNVICEYFNSVYPNVGLSEVTTEMIDNFYSNKRNTETSANTIKHYHVNINEALKFAVKKGLIDINPASDAKHYKIKKKEVTYYNADEVKALFEAFKGDRMWIAICLAAYLGLRRGEVVGLRWSNIDFEKGTILISESAFVTYGSGKGVIKTREGVKTEASRRTLPMCNSLKQILLDKRASDANNASVLRKGYCHDYDDYVCTDNFGHLLSPDFITSHFAHMLKKKKLKKITFHGLRHSCASVLLENGQSLFDIKQWLGHSTISVTADYYAHRDFKAKVGAANAINNAFSSGDNDLHKGNDTTGDETTE